MREGGRGVLGVVREPAGDERELRQRLAVIIVSYNTRNLLRECLRSVEAADGRTKWLDVDVIVVDNASTDGSAAMVVEEFPQVDLVASPENLGFTGGNNLALARLGLIQEDKVTGWQGDKMTGRQGDKVTRSGQSPVNSLSHPVTPSPCHPLTLSPPHLVMLLNPDTILDPAALKTMTTFLRDHPHIGACGAHLRYGDGSFQHGAFRFPSLAQIVLDLWPLAEIKGLRRLHEWLRDSCWNGRYSQKLWQGDAPFLVDFVLGAAMMVQAEAVRQVGGLDDGYFMYCEEMDWALTMRRAGWRIYAVPAARVVHYEGQSSRQVRWSAFEQLWQSRFRFYRKHRMAYPPGHLRALRALVRLGAWMRASLARHRFAHGRLTGEQVAEELAAYRALSQL